MKPEKKERIIRTCLRKKVYKKRSDAEHAIHSMGKDNRLHAYKCPACGDWHIGHIVPKAVRLAP